VSVLYVELPDPVKRDDGQWWIPRFPPHYFVAMGPYASLLEAEADRCGVENTINSPDWRSVIQDLQEEGVL